MILNADDQFKIAIDNSRYAAHHYPVLASVVVHLQAEAGTGLDLNTLDLEARTIF